MRKGDWISTFTGQRFYPLDPRPDEIVLEDIAHALSNTCRFTGHCKYFYSVAEHSVHIARQLPPKLRKQALLHDAAEAYIADVARPVKPALKEYGSIEQKLMKAIAEKFRQPWPFDPEIKRLDNCIVWTEGEALLREGTKGWSIPGTALDIDLPCWPPEDAKQMWLSEWFGVEFGK